jgi:hypothetical protein
MVAADVEKGATSAPLSTAAGSARIVIVVHQTLGST